MALAWIAVMAQSQPRRDSIREAGRLTASHYLHVFAAHSHPWPLVLITAGVWSSTRTFSFAAQSVSGKLRARAVRGPALVR